MLTTVNIEALKQLRRVVIAAPDDRFDMSAYGKRTKCGTVCCAAGWAALDPWFQANTTIGQVLPVDARPESEREEFGSDQLFDFSQFLNGGGHPADGLSQVFGLSLIQADCLFLPDKSKVVKSQVIANIDAIIGGGNPKPYENDDDDVDDDDDGIDDDDEDEADGEGGGPADLDDPAFDIWGGSWPADLKIVRDDKPDEEPA
jgi:hypothetical protein